MRDLIDGYDYLNAISNQIPNHIRKTAEGYRNNLLSLSTSSLINNEDDTNPGNLTDPSSHRFCALDDIEKSSQQLEMLKNELRCITQERLVMDIVNRQTFDIKLKPYPSSSSSNASRKPDSKWSFSAGTAVDDGTRSKEHGNRAFIDRLSMPRSKTVNKYGSTTSSYRRINSKKTDSERRIRDSLLMEYIEIPTYDSNIDSDQNNEPTPANPSKDAVVRVRSVRDSQGRKSEQLVVPSLRQGPLPSELSELKIGTTQSPFLINENDADKKSKGKVKVLPLTRYLYQRVKKNENEVGTIKDLLVTNVLKQEQDGARTQSQLRHLESTIVKQKDDIQIATSSMVSLIQFYQCKHS